MGAEIVSAGGIVYRIKNSSVEVKLITTKRWPFSFPKGRVEKGECLEDCAIRETKEEAGADAKIEAFLGTAKWRLKDGGNKVVHMYLMKLVKDGKVADPDNEIIKARWKPIDEAMELVDFPPMNKLLVKAAKLIRR